ncbi:MAG: endonuclease/exonuclease/phosphatase family protein, partial [Opitutaceae bacterium]|nr:endonuclease/exonuclease/phosphatase family protein [Opitutaceae bacterium]
MKKRLLRASVFLFATVTLFVRAAPPAADDAAPTASARQAAVLNVATYNLRVAHADDEKSGNGWGLRKPALRDVIQSIAPDILGTQEGNDRQLAELLPLLPGYACEKALYAGKKGNAHNCAILYKSSRFN